jgi:hypothetical protein
MSLIEWRAALAGRFPRTPAKPMTRVTLTDLMKQFPDANGE